jgi:PKD repeat protein
MKKFTLVFSLILLTALWVQAQVARNMVAVEITTSTFCTYCPGAMLGLDDLVANGCRVAGIEHHNDWQGNDPFVTPASQARSNYYNPGGNPGAFFDGVLSVVGGNHTTSMYPNYLPKYNQRIAIPSPISIGYTVTRNGLQFVFNFIVKKESDLPNNLLTFQFTATESNIQYTWQGQSQLEYVNRLMVPDQSGTPLDFTSTDVQNVTITANLDPLWALDNIEFVAFVQNTSGKEILQTIRPVITDFEASTPTDICQHSGINFSNSSVGRPSTTLWLFPGGSPSSSTSEAPSIIYHIPGMYDVTMITTTGLDSDTVVKTDYVNIRPGAEVTDPIGPQIVCTNNPSSSTTYSTSSISASQYIWDLYPASGAGTIINNGATATINWVNNWYGTASIRVKGINDCGEGVWTQYMDISAVNCTGVESNAQILPVSVYPNPASKDLNVVLNCKNPDLVEVRLMNAVGKVVAHDLVQVNGKAVSNLNVSRLSEGMYFLSINGKEIKSSFKITIQR